MAAVVNELSQPMIDTALKMSIESIDVDVQVQSSSLVGSESELQAKTVVQGYWQWKR